jgi:hypothetical protein
MAGCLAWVQGDGDGGRLEGGWHGKRKISAPPFWSSNDFHGRSCDGAAETADELVAQCSSNGLNAWAGVGPPASDIRHGASADIYDIL